MVRARVAGLERWCSVEDVARLRDGVKRPDQLSGDRVEIKKKDVGRRTPSKLSPMPEGLVNILTKEEILDLLAYIEAGGKREHAAFTR